MLILTLVMAAIELFSVALLIPLFSAVLIGESGAESVPLLLGFDLPSFKNTDGNLNLLISIAFIALLSKATLSMVLSYWQTKLSNHVTIMLRRRIIQKFFNSPYLEYTSNKRSDFIYLANELNTNFIRIFASLLKTFSDTILFIGFIFLLGVIDISLLMGLGIVLTMWLLLNNKIFGAALKKIGYEINQLSSTLIDLVTQSYDGFKQILSLGSATWLTDRIINISQAIASRNIIHSIIFQAQTQSLELISGSLVLGSIYWISITDTPPELAITKIGIFGFTLLRLRPIALHFNRTISDYRYHQNAIVLLKAGVGYRERCSKKITNIKPSKKRNDNDFRFNSFELKELNFCYSKNLPPIFTDANIHFNNGQLVGICGQSGTGKSTLLDIISGLLQPNKATILINRSYSKDTKYEFFKSIGYVTQQNFFFRGTLAENVLMGLEASPENLAKINPALKKAGLDEFLDRYDLVIGERGAGISGGQQQRLALTRMFVQNKRILILDEATNALDKKTEEHIFQGLKKNASDISVIFVSHSPCTLKFADIIYNIHKGRITKRKSNYTQFQDHK